VFVSFNETTWWVFDKATIVGVCGPIICRGTAKTCEERHALQIEAVVVEERHHHETKSIR